MSSREDGFLSRWAKRKADVRETEARETEERKTALAPQPGEGGMPANADNGQPAVVDEDARDVPPDDETRQRWIEELEAVDIDTLTYDNDFTIFMKSWVPGPLRQRALRKLWTTNPALAVLDGLNDYDLDYTDAAMQAGKVVSSYVPGSGYKALEDVAEKLAEVLDDDEHGAGEDDLPEFEGEEAALPDDDGQADGVQPDDADTAVKDLQEQQVDETAIAVPQNDVKLKS
ncbi:DUF3306 domain-containing protein [Anderseniella sp. Alg231-50]|uniref:DUF3306 domain-containing protein n=1 Tax=Anderseniella sp. Alg231-50 TaxID=1922226 RepID=UPI00307B7804